MDFSFTLKAPVSGRADVALAGAINENSGAALTRLRKALVGASHVAFDCLGVDQINSTGLRLWKDFLKSMKGAISYEYLRCSVYFVDYANMSPALVEGGLITSFFAPFHCPGCKVSHEVLLQRKSLLPGSFGPQSCPKCAAALEPEVSEDSYLDFLLP